MAIFFVTVANGQSVSSPVTLNATDRTLAVAVGSHASLSWYAWFQATAGGPFTRYLDAWNVFSGALFSGTGGAWGIVPFPPATVVRIETSAAVSATTSVCLVEIVR